jgi:hypothetical protein
MPLAPAGIEAEFQRLTSHLIAEQKRPRFENRGLFISCETAATLTGSRHSLRS